MAEYIDREKLIPDRCYYEPYGYEAVSCEQIFHEDTVDAVEREKIDKAIEEMKALANPENTILGFDEKMGLMTAMNILVRNIGEGVESK